MFMTPTTCPFCGLATDVPHNTQEGCIEALQAEIARIRHVLEHVTPAEPRPPVPPEEAETDLA